MTEVRIRLSKSNKGPTVEHGVESHLVFSKVCVIALLPLTVRKIDTIEQQMAGNTCERFSYFVSTSGRMAGM